MLVLRQTAEDQVRRLVAGPGVYICDECVNVCLDILEAELMTNPDRIAQQSAYRTSETKRNHAKYFRNMLSNRMKQKRLLRLRFTTTIRELHSANTDE